MARHSLKKHAKVKPKTKDLKKKEKKEPKPSADPSELIDEHYFVTIPEAEAVPEDVEAELRAFRAARVTFAAQVKQSLKETSELDPEIKQAYMQIGKILKTYRSGKLPKPFKIIPNLEKWEEVLTLCKPDRWTPQAMGEAVKIFCSSMGPRQAQIFYNEYLYSAVRQNIQKYKKLNYHYYTALKKAFYKPAAWFKGLLLPLCQEPDCTLKEAAILASVIAKVSSIQTSVPVLHASAAMVKLCEQEYSGSQSVFIKVLLEKGYALPAKVLQAVVSHFLKAEMDDRNMPVLWHQCLLVFVQKYGASLPAEVVVALKNLLRVQNHAHITPEIRKFLSN